MSTCDLQRTEAQKKVMIIRTENNKKEQKSVIFLFCTQEDVVTFLSGLLANVQMMTTIT